MVSFWKLRAKKSYSIYVVKMKFSLLVGLFSPLMTKCLYYQNYTRYSKNKLIFEFSGIKLV